MADNEQNSNENGLSPELVRKVADRVYAMLLADLKRERERRGRKDHPKRKR